MCTLYSSPIDPQCLSGHIDEVMDRTLADKRLVGAVIKVAINGTMVYSRAAGYADRGLNRLMREDALFRLASVTKPIVSTAALILVAQGRLQLDDRVDRWLPEFRPRLQNGELAQLTVRHLMTHTAGLSYRFFQEENSSYQRAGISDGMDQSGITLEENMRRLASVPLLYTPGTEWRYSIATDVLGAVIAKVTETTLSEAIDSLVTKPLGMSDTGFIAADPERLATPMPTTTRSRGHYLIPTRLPLWTVQQASCLLQAGHLMPPPIPQVELVWLAVPGTFCTCWKHCARAEPLCCRNLWFTK